MKSFNRELFCNTDELEDVLKDILECIYIANKLPKSGEFSKYVDVRKLNIKYENGFCSAQFEYEIKNKNIKDDNEKGTFREST